MKPVRGYVLPWRGSLLWCVPELLPFPRKHFWEDLHSSLVFFPSFSLSLAVAFLPGWQTPQSCSQYHYGYAEQWNAVE